MGKGQSSTEYVIILAVVLTILLVGLSLMGFFSGFSSDTLTGESQSFWANAASPFAILDTKFAGSSLGIIVHNRASTTLSLTGMSISSGNSSYAPAGFPYNVVPGQKLNFSIAMPEPCQSGKIYEYLVLFNYSTDSVVSLSQVGGKPLMVRCVS